MMLFNLAMLLASTCALNMFNATLGGKKYSLCLSRNKEFSNVQQLDDDFTPKMIPNMLGSLQIYSQHFWEDSYYCNFYHALTLYIVHEIMQDWKRTLIYEYLMEEPHAHLVTKQEFNATEVK